MAKGDDAIAKNRNKAIRKRNRRAGADSIEAIQGVQAAKRRRKAGTRRACEGMCYTLPTPEDPFLDRRDRKLKMEKKREAARKAASLEPVSFVEKLSFNGKEYQGGEDAGESDDDVAAGYGKQLKRKRGKLDLGEADEPVIPQKKRKVDSNGVAKQKAVGNGHSVHKGSNVNASGPQVAVKVADAAAGNGLTPEGGDIKGDVSDEMVLAVVSKAGHTSPEGFVNGKGLNSASLSANPLAKQFWKAYSLGVDVVATCSCSLEERALGIVAPSAAHVKAQRVKDDVPRQPLVLIVVVSQDQALRVRRVFRPLKKALGITSVCLHDGTSLERQTDGLKTHTPDVVVATPDRLCDLLSVQAITLSGVSLFVVDELSEIIERGLQSHVSKVKEYVSRGSRKVILSKSYPERAVIIARQLVADPIVRVISEKSLESSSACITQTVSVFTNDNKRMSKMLKILQQFWDQKQERKENWTVLVVVENEETAQAVLPELLKKGYSFASLTSTRKQKIDTTVKQIREGSLQALVCTAEVVGHVPLEKMLLLINYSFPASVEVYEQILTGMARESVDGVLHTFCTAAMASSASQLVQVLRSCSQEVPRALQMLAEAASLVQLGLSK